MAYRNDTRDTLVFTKGVKDGVAETVDLRRDEVSDLAGVDMNHPRNRALINAGALTEVKARAASAKPKE